LGQDPLSRLSSWAIAYGEGPDWEEDSPGPETHVKIRFMTTMVGGLDGEDLCWPSLLEPLEF